MTTTSTRRKKRFGRNRTRQVGAGDRQSVLETLGDMPIQRDLLIEYLHKLQDRYSHISAGHIVALADLMKLAPAELYEVDTFYSMYNLSPVGKYFVQVCTTTPCMISGAEKIVKICKSKTHYKGHSKYYAVNKNDSTFNISNISA